MNNIGELKKGDAVICEHRQGRTPFVGYVTEILGKDAFLLKFWGIKKAKKVFASDCTVDSNIWHSIYKIDLSTVDTETKDKLDFVLQKIEGRKKKVKSLTIVEALNLAKQGFSITNDKLKENGSYISLIKEVYYICNTSDESAIRKSDFTIDEVLANWQVVKVNDLKNNKSN